MLYIWLLYILKKVLWKYYRYIFFKIRIYGFKRFSLFNCLVFRIGLFYKFIFYVGSVVIVWLIFKWNRMCVVILWGVCCWLIIGDWSDLC